MNRENKFPVHIKPYIDFFVPNNFQPMGNEAGKNKAKKGVVVEAPKPLVLPEKQAPLQGVGPFSPFPTY